LFLLRCFEEEEKKEGGRRVESGGMKERKH